MEFWTYALEGSSVCNHKILEISQMSTIRKTSIGIYIWYTIAQYKWRNCIFYISTQINFNNIILSGKSPITLCTIWYHLCRFYNINYVFFVNIYVFMLLHDRFVIVLASEKGRSVNGIGEVSKVELNFLWCFIIFFKETKANMKKCWHLFIFEVGYIGVSFLYFFCIFSPIKKKSKRGWPFYQSMWIQKNVLMIFCFKIHWE